jgi:tRNA A37 threonylcarbamoyladenosine synthetase subunit TsaC/SUA5/YrdC
MPYALRAQSLTAIFDYREWQLVQTSLSEMTFKIVAPTPPTERELRALRDYLAVALPAHRTTIALVDAIANPMANGKPYEAFLSLIDPPA